MLGLMWRTVIASYDLMKKYITCRHQTETVVVISFLPVQSSHDKLLYDAELKKYKMKKSDTSWLSAENHGWPVVTRPSPALI